MTLKAYLDNIQVQTGRTPEELRVLAKKKGLLEEGVKTGKIVAWLKEDFGLGQGHAMAIVLTFKNASLPRMSKNENIAKLFGGARAIWLDPYQALLTKVKEFGSDISENQTDTYISLLRKGKKFGIVQVSSKRLDIGIKLKNKTAEGRFEESGDWNAMVTHRVRISDPKQIDGEVLLWLKQAYDKALPVKASRRSQQTDFNRQRAQDISSYRD
jgi:hypothetical protein